MPDWVEPDFCFSGLWKVRKRAWSLSGTRLDGSIETVASRFRHIRPNGGLGQPVWCIFCCGLGDSVDQSKLQTPVKGGPDQYCSGTGRRLRAICAWSERCYFLRVVGDFD